LDLGVDRREVILIALEGYAELSGTRAKALAGECSGFARNGAGGEETPPGSALAARRPAAAQGELSLTERPVFAASVAASARIWAVLPEAVSRRAAAVSTSPACPMPGSTRQEPTACTATGSSTRRKRAMSRSWIIMSRKRPPERAT